MLKDFVKGIRKIITRPKKLVALSTARTSSGDFLLKKTDFGLVRVEFETVEKLARRALSEVKELQEAELAVEEVASNVTPMRIRLTATLAEGYSAPRASQAADKIINDELKQSLGEGFYVPVDVKIKQIIQVVTPKRRVR